MPKTIYSMINFESYSTALMSISEHYEITKISYKMLLNISQHLSSKFNFKPGQKIILILTNSLEFVCMFLAITISGAIAAPLNPNFTKNELKNYINRIQPDRIVIDKSNCLFLTLKTIVKNDQLIPLKKGFVKDFSPSSFHNEIPKCEEKSDCLLLFTSGTTNQPKCVILNHFNLSNSAKNIAESLALDEKDSTMIVMPLFHVHGLIGSLLSTLISGGTCVIPNKFSSRRFWSEFKTGNCSWFSAVPTIHKIISNDFEMYFNELNESDRSQVKKKLRFVRSCSSALSRKLYTDLRNALNVPIIQAYAMTETSHQICSIEIGETHLNDRFLPIGSQSVVEMAIMDRNAVLHFPRDKIESRGEIVVKGLTVFGGYKIDSAVTPLQNSESFINGFFRTGDIGRLDREGLFYIEGRSKEIINRGGEKISPYEIEEVILQIGEIDSAVVFAISDEIYGEEVAAAVVLKPTTTQKDYPQRISCDSLPVEVESIKKEVRDVCRRELAAFKCPKKIFFLKELPKTATGKVQRTKIENFLKNANYMENIK